MPVPARGSTPSYRGTYDCARKTVAAEGVRGLYKGMGAPLACVTPVFAMCFLGYNLGKKMVVRDEEHLKYVCHFLMFFVGIYRWHEVLFAGMISGLFTTVVIVPEERMKVLLQVVFGFLLI